MAWRQGEHVCVIGSTGSGKTTLVSKIVPYRQYVIVFRTKPDDLTWPGFRRVKRARDIDPTRHPKWILEPDYESQRIEFAKAMEMAWRDGSWCLVFDEMYHIQHVGLKALAEKNLTQGRAKDISVVGGVQRPVEVTRFIFSEPRHVFAFNITDGRDLKTIRDWLGEAFAYEITQLGEYEFAYRDVVRKRIVRGTIRTLNEVLGANPLGGP